MALHVGSPSSPPPPPPLPLPLPRPLRHALRPPR
uniref:Uncharacterized protein n=1 Tax=Arundo donax TaxID=35708 RepID=A0A0A9EMV4_ARUDO